MKTVFILGCNGYIGNALTLRLLNRGYNVVGIDNDIKEKWAKSIGSISAIERPLLTERIENFKSFGNGFNFHRVDLVKDTQEFSTLLTLYKPETVVHLAHQPSAAYSHLSLKAATETFINNNIGTLNLIWLLRNKDWDIHLIEIESMGIYQPEIGVPIPEGLFEFEYLGMTSKKSLFPKRPGSFYHSSKINNTFLIDAANRWWGMTATMVNQGVVYGNYTDEIEETKLHSPLWADECFGTVINRFIIQMMLEHPLTIYGGGEQRRGFLSLSDSIQCLELLIKNRPEKGKMRIVNQIDQIYTINEIATKVDLFRVGNTGLIGRKDNIESPRKECTGSFHYLPETKVLKDLGFKHTRSVEAEVEYAMKNISSKKLKRMKSLLVPNIKW